MNNFMRVFLGFVAGVLATIFVLALIARSQNNRARNELIKEVLISLKEEEGMSNEVVWFDLTTAKGQEVRLCTQMPKEEVKQLLGKPDKTSVRQGYDGKIHETWEYEKRYDKGYDLMVTDFIVYFENDKLTSVSQY